jgi:hypothetical protein
MPATSTRTTERGPSPLSKPSRGSSTPRSSAASPLTGVGVVALLARAPWPHALRAVPGGLDTTVLVGITVLSVRQLRIRPEQ